MKFSDLVKLYEEKKKIYSDNAYKHISKLLEEAKVTHKKDFLKSKTADKATKEGRTPDHEQSWRAFKGKNLEKLIGYIIKKEIEDLGLKITNDAALDSDTLTEELSRVRRNLVVHYGKYDIVPDTDLVIYDPIDYQIIAIISSKVTLRERIAQTAYWKLKLSQDPVTKNIKALFVTPDENGDLVEKLPSSHGNSRGFKGRIIVEYDTDGAYVLREVEESEKVKKFPKLIDDIRRIVHEKQKRSK